MYLAYPWVTRLSNPFVGIYQALTLYIILTLIYILCSQLQFTILPLVIFELGTNTLFYLLWATLK